MKQRFKAEEEWSSCSVLDLPELVICYIIVDLPKLVFEFAFVDDLVVDNPTLPFTVNILHL